MPDEAACLAILRAASRRTPLAPDADLPALAAHGAAAGLSGADLAALLSEAQLAAVHEELAAREAALARRAAGAAEAEASAGAAVVGSLIAASPAAAEFVSVPKGFKRLVDKLDGYEFFYPELWSPVTTSGNDVFLRNPFNIEENLFVDISSPSSSRYSSVLDLGTPEAAAKTKLDQYLNKEFMSTRLGIKRVGEIISADSRVADDGRTYYDIVIRMASYGSRNAYATTQQEVMNQYGLEWDRRLTTTLGVANNRLYELRLQSASEGFEDKSGTVVAMVQQSFRVKEVEA
ncbi:PsbP domain-containing protein 1 [Monoraphidium neglectum]|uniref:PsbP domain-containing protein 1 n=1 Tax=Monoraphidium neglectum TaxID=145388 RepID=A0A0D2LXX4_9CHLO|nr:PsbP domain-containing protein 1 [Monoraphidium neglectum]KIY96254.1 PsbP domain-containing protein 1 [Monoraphidium neglectum]|eukprot:XP_013895274.1 PsbP domain-containing protein 1 [Monoraphidium neglectum]